MTISVSMSSNLQSAEKAKAAIDKTIRDGATRLKAMSANDVSSFLSALPAQDRGFVDRTAGAFRKMSAGQMDQVVAYMGVDQKRRLAAAFAKLPEATEKSSSTSGVSQLSAGPAAVIKKASTAYLGGLVYGKSVF